MFLKGIRSKLLLARIAGLWPNLSRCKKRPEPICGTKGVETKIVLADSCAQSALKAARRARSYASIPASIQGKNYSDARRAPCDSAQRRTWRFTGEPTPGRRNTCAMCVGKVSSCKVVAKGRRAFLVSLKRGDPIPYYYRQSFKGCTLKMEIDICL